MRKTNDDPLAVELQSLLDEGIGTSSAEAVVTIGSKGCCAPGRSFTTPGPGSGTFRGRFWLANRPSPLAQPPQLIVEFLELVRGTVSDQGPLLHRDSGAKRIVRTTHTVLRQWPRRNARPRRGSVRAEESGPALFFMSG